MDITDDMIAEARRMIGVRRDPAYRHNYEASADAIRHFANGIGDDNPLWTNREYAEKTRFGQVIAPPTFVLTCGMFRYSGFRGVHGMNAGYELDFLEPIPAGSPVLTSTWLDDLVEHEGRFAGRSVEEIHMVEYSHPDGTVFARGRQMTMRTSRESGRQHGKYASYHPGKYSDSELEKVRRHYSQETRRGSVTRFWEDVSVGEELPTLAKGPLTQSDIIAFMIGWGSAFIRGAHRIQYAFLDRHPSAFGVNDSGIPDIPERVHWDSGFAQSVGALAAYDYGPQRTSWLAHLMTDYAGDGGWLKSIAIRLRRHNFVGDLTWCRGRVVAAELHGGVGTVTCEIWAEDQRGERTAEGSATVLLPCRGVAQPAAPLLHGDVTPEPGDLADRL